MSDLIRLSCSAGHGHWALGTSADMPSWAQKPAVQGFWPLSTGHNSRFATLTLSAVQTPWRDLKSRALFTSARILTSRS